MKKCETCPKKGKCEKCKKCPEKSTCDKCDFCDEKWTHHVIQVSSVVRCCDSKECMEKASKVIAGRSCSE